MNATTAVLIGFVMFAGCTNLPVESDTPASMEGILNEALSSARLVGIAGGQLSGGSVKSYGVGLRIAGSADPISSDDRFQIGSLAKAMTATMVGTLVRDSILTWNTSIAQVFPEIDGTIPSALGTVTMRKLLQHRGGITAFPSTIEEVMTLQAFEGTPREQRAHYVSWILAASDPAKIDSFQYSNPGYLLAAAMCERVTGRSWEELMNERLFLPLGITAYYEWPAEHGRRQPWGHVVTPSGYMPFNPDSTVQFPDAFSPAGQISLTVSEYLRFAQLHCDALNGHSSLLSKEIALTLHAPVGEYAMGWIEVKDAATGIPIAFHDGSDETFEAFVVLQPSRNSASVAFTNCSSPAVGSVLAHTCVDLLANIR